MHGQGTPPVVVLVDAIVSRAEDRARQVQAVRAARSRFVSAVCYALATLVHGDETAPVVGIPDCCAALQALFALAIVTRLREHTNVGWWVLAEMCWVDIALLLHHITKLETSPTKVNRVACTCACGGGTD